MNIDWRLVWTLFCIACIAGNAYYTVYKFMGGDWDWIAHALILTALLWTLAQEGART